MERDLPGAFVVSGDEFVCPDSLFWDNYNHLWGEGRTERTDRVIRILGPVLGPAGSG